MQGERSSVFKRCSVSRVQGETGAMHEGCKGHEEFVVLF